MLYLHGSHIPASTIQHCANRNATAPPKHHNKHHFQEVIPFIALMNHCDRTEKWHKGFDWKVSLSCPWRKLGTQKKITSNCTYTHKNTSIHRALGHVPNISPKSCNSLPLSCLPGCQISHHWLIAWQIISIGSSDESIRWLASIRAHSYTGTRWCIVWHTSYGRREST